MKYIVKITFKNRVELVEEFTSNVLVQIYIERLKNIFADSIEKIEISEEVL